MLKGIDGF